MDFEWDAEVRKKVLVGIASVMVLGGLGFYGFQAFNPNTPFQVVVDQQQRAVEACYEKTKSFATCTGGIAGLQGNVKSPLEFLPIKGNMIQRMETRGGIIIVKAIKGFGFEGENFVYVPHVISNKIEWGLSGTCVNTKRCVLKDLSGNLARINKPIKKLSKEELEIQNKILSEEEQAVQNKLSDEHQQRQVVKQEMNSILDKAVSEQ
ncbi:MAG: hypothetical protein WA056_02295 [Gallionella sp.]